MMGSKYGTAFFPTCIYQLVRGASPLPLPLRKRSGAVAARQWKEVDETAEPL